MGYSVDPVVVTLGAADAAAVGTVGGKAAQLSRVTHIPGVRVPAGFCVTTAAFRRATATVPIDTDAATTRHAIERVDIPGDVAGAIADAVAQLGVRVPVAVRSSATAEDLPTASFAGQYDTFLGIVGTPAILDHVRRCWASLFSDRAVACRRRHRIADVSAAMAVVVQRLVDARVSGILFTADPVTGHRKVTTIEATADLGDAHVGGSVSPEVHRVRDGRIIERPTRGDEPVLTEQEALELAAVGEAIGAQAGSPQDVEWCIDDEGVAVVQSRPITTLFPVPSADDDAPRVYVSVGHGQMMTDPMTPLGLSFWQLISPAPMRVAGGRLFVDVTEGLSSPSSRAALLDVFGRGDPLIRDALDTVLARGDLSGSVHDDAVTTGRPAASAPPEPAGPDPAIVGELVARTRASVGDLRRRIDVVSGPALLDLIVADLAELRATLYDPPIHHAVMAAFESTWWLNDHLEAWLGERNAADVLSLFTPGDVTAEMGLALLDVADAIRPFDAVGAFLHDADDDGFLDALPHVEPGGRVAHDAITSYLDAYGMRCVGEIDIARPRWREQPSALLPMILSNVERFEPGERVRRVEDGRQRARAWAGELLARLRSLPGGDAKAAQTEAMIERLWTFLGFREYPKYGMVQRLFAYKQALLAEAERLVRDGGLHRTDDIFFLTFDELHDAVRAREGDVGLVARRRHDFRAFHDLAPPRVLTSDGECLNGAYRRDDLPADALPGLAVAPGVVEGRARVVLDIDDADVEPGDILVTPHADPSWSPLFVSVAGLVTEVGGLMTHGAVVAREYGIVAVVAVERATERILDGQHIRVDGTTGIVQLLDDTAPR